MKFALVAHTVPPATGGNSVIILRLLSGLDPASYCVVTEGEDDLQSGVRDDDLRLPARHYSLPKEFHRLAEPEQVRLFRDSVFLDDRLLGLVPGTLRPRVANRAALVARRVARVRAMLRGVRISARLIEDVLREEGCGAVVAFSGDFQNLPASYLAARRAGARFHAFICDYYSHQWVVPLYAFLARRLEPFLLRRADGVIVLNEVMRDEVREAFGRESEVIHPPADIELHESHAARAPEAFDGEVDIVFTGAVSPAQADALASLLEAVELSPRTLNVHVYSAQSQETIDGLGVRGRFVYHPHVPQPSVPAIQRAADILFLPLAFSSPYPAVVRTATPTKLGDYLASRRPILVHAPGDSFVSRYFREHGCGVVVDERDPARLVEAIERLAADVELQERVTARAWERAQVDFSIPAMQARFLAVLERGVSSAPRPRG